MRIVEEFVVFGWG